MGMSSGSIYIVWFWLVFYSANIKYIQTGMHNTIHMKREIGKDSTSTSAVVENIDSVLNSGDATF